MKHPSTPAFLTTMTALLPLTHASLPAVPCSPSSFTFPALAGAQPLSILAESVQNLTTYPQTFPDALLTTGPLNFCKVSIAYTHLGHSDTINVRLWLPTTHWNGRYVSTGGGGWVTGYLDGEMFTPWLANGSAVAATDGGHARTANASFALKSPGSLDYNAIANFASVALADLGVIGKAITTQFYAAPPRFAYWYGCSMGGRQGFQMAQTEPAAYDGILALAPALRVDRLPASLWPQVLLNELGKFPPPCEVDALLAEAVRSCDGLDGVRDGVISRPDLCRFDVRTLAGKRFECGDLGERVFSREGIAVAKAFWEGSPAVLPLGQRAWPGMPVGTPLRINVSEVSLVATACDGKGEACRGVLIDLFMTMVRFMIKKDPEYTPTVISEEEYYGILRVARQTYYSLLGTDDADLSPFKKAGGKLLTLHGLTDQLLSPCITKDYVERVKKNDKGYQDYLRYFEMPGVEHCGGGKGAWPLGSFDKLVDWVERGVAPDTLLAVDQNSFATRDTANAKQRLLCLYPKVPKFKGGDPDKSTSYTCVSR